MADQTRQALTPTAAAAIPSCIMKASQRWLGVVLLTLGATAASGCSGTTDSGADQAAAPPSTVVAGDTSLEGVRFDVRRDPG